MGQISLGSGRPRAEATRTLSAHIPALDGIRGLAVLLVLYCHSTLIEPGGAIGKLFLATSRISFSGVDLFFVLSGFLITGILFDAKGKDHYFRNFYARRTVRIFPLYYAFLVIAFILMPALPASVRGVYSAEFPQHTVWYWLYLSNFYQAIHPTHHLSFVSWSLAIEEQFYLCWPLVVFLCSGRTLRRICAAVVFGSLAMRCTMWFGTSNWRILSCWTPFRLDGLAAGAWIALTARSNDGGIGSLLRPAKIVGAIAAAALLALVVACYALGWRGGIGQSPLYVTVGFTVLAFMFGAMLVIAVNAEPQSVVGRIFASRFLRVFGKYSYAVYLLHRPVSMTIQNFLLDPARGGASAAMQFARQGMFYLLVGVGSLAVAWVSWNALEKHFLKIKDWFPMAPRPLPTEPPGSDIADRPIAAAA